MIKIFVWLISLIGFSWCYSTVIMCILFMKQVPTAKVSLIVYTIILIALYIISYFALSKYFNDILICSIIALILSFITPKKI